MQGVSPYKQPRKDCDAEGVRDLLNELCSEERCWSEYSVWHVSHAKLAGG